MSRRRSDERDKAFRMWERSGRTMPLVQIAKRLGISAALVRKWKYEDAWEARPSRNRGGQPGNKNAIGNKGGGAPPGNQNNWKNGNYTALWMSHKEVVHRLETAKTETDPKRLLENEIMLLEFREDQLVKNMIDIENGWDAASKKERFSIYQEEVGENITFLDGMPKAIPVKETKDELVERIVSTPQKLERLLSIQNTLTQVQGRKLKAISLLDQLNRNELTDEELQLRIQRMQLEVDKLRMEAW